MKQKILYIFTRTPLHIGAGSSVGAIDQPVQRERHTGFPIIPGSSMKGCFADQWPTGLSDNGKSIRVKTEKNEKGKWEVIEASETSWLFGSDDANVSFAGALQFSEARVLAFPIRSARGSYAWITCPMMLQRAKRDGVFSPKAAREIAALNEPKEEARGTAIFQAEGDLAMGEKGTQIVLEEYCFYKDNQSFPIEVETELAALLDDDLWRSIKGRLVILSNGAMTHFALTACDVAQHVKISDETGTAEGSALFNQENVPSETLLYSILHCCNGRGYFSADHGEKSYDSTKAAEAFESVIEEKRVFQFGADASTGLGFCTIEVADPVDTRQVS